MQLMLIDLFHKLKLLYPASTSPVSAEVGTVAVYVHNAATRDQCVSEVFPISFWRETTILCDLVVFLRDPMYFRGVDEISTAHARQFSF